MGRPRKTVKKQRGGRYINRGSYGCGFSPALRCAHEQTRRAGKFAKLALKETAYLEHALGKRLRRHDPTQRYFLYPEAVCKPAPLAPEDEGHHCPAKFLELDKSRIIFTSRGGLNLASFQPRARDYPAFFASLTNLFDGLAILHAAGIGHNDVKPHNIVTKRHSNGEYQTRLIDFGLMIDCNRLAQQVMKEGHIFHNYVRFNRNYLYWSFDIRMMDPRVVNAVIARSDVIRPILDEYNEEVTREDPFIPYKAFRNPPLKVRDVLEIAGHLDRMPSLVDRYKMVSSMSDVLSLGLTLAETYCRLTGHRDRGEEDVEVVILDGFGLERGGRSSSGFSSAASDDVGAYVDIDDAAEDYDEDDIAWHAAVRDRVSVPLYTLVRRMINPNALDRVDLATAAAAYRAILPDMTAMFTEEWVLRHLKPDALEEAADGSPVRFGGSGSGRSSSSPAAAAAEAAAVANVAGPEPVRTPRKSASWYEMVRDSHGRLRKHRIKTSAPLLAS